MESKGVCESCLSSEKAGKLHDNTRSIGNEVLIISKVGRGKDRTEHVFFQCINCGSVWVKLVDSGAGGHGLFYQRLTKSLF